MIVKTLAFLRSNQRLSGILLIFLVVFLAYFQTLRMYVWQDDHAVMFKLQHPEEQAGQFGTGIYDRSSAYRGVTSLLLPIYNLFGSNPFAFYFFGMLAYFFASLAVYYLAKSLTSNTKVALASALIFASGYIGAESLWRIFNSIHTSHTVVFLCLTLILYKKFIEQSHLHLNRAIGLYLLSLFVFVYTIDTGFVRAHGIIFLVVAVELLWNFHPLNSILRLAPFGKLYFDFYIFNNSTSPELIILLNQIFQQQQFDLVLTPLKNLHNIMIPSLWQIPLVGFILALIVILLKSKSKLLWFGLAFMLGNYLVFFIHTPSQVFPSLHRYFLLPAVGNALFMSCFLGKFLKQNKFYLAIALIVLLHLVLLNKEHTAFINERTDPEKRFYESLKQQLPSILEKSAIYFDVRNDAKSTQEFANFFGVGSMPDTTAIAWQYGIDRGDLTLPGTFMELLSLLKKGQTTINQIYTFYYDTEGGLTNTTKMTRQALSQPSPRLVINDSQNINMPFSSIVEMSLYISAFFDRSKSSLEGKTPIELVTYLKYLESKNKYYQNAKATATSQWKFHEVRNIVDNDVNTNWAAHRLNWFYKKFDSVTIDLGEPKTVAAVKMVYTSKDLVPTSYSYNCSRDGISWKNVGKFSFIPVNTSGTILDNISISTCQFIKMDVVATSSGDSPQIAELEVIESLYQDLNFVKANQIAKNPFLFVYSEQEWELLKSYLIRSGIEVEACFYTDKSIKPYCQMLVIFPNSSKKYSLIISPNGTILKSMEIKLPLEIKVDIKSLEILPLTYSELEKRNLIVDYIEN